MGQFGLRHSTVTTPSQRNLSTLPAIMDKMNTEEFKENSAKSETGFSLANLIIGIVMVAIGYQNLPQEMTGAPAVAEDAEQDPCPNGAAYWLYVAGICLLVSNSINTWAKIYKKCAERDGKIDCGEKIGMGVNKMSSGVMTIIDFVMLIWGSVVVFGAWATWTDNLEEYKADMENLNYCEYQPMIFAFSILLIKWIMIPVMIALTCCCVCCGAMCCACFKPATPESA